MREASLSQFSATDCLNSLRHTTKSLSYNILVVSPCGSIFYPDWRRHSVIKSLRINILADRREKMWAARYPNCLRPRAKSLFQNILPVTPCGSRFYPDPWLSPPTKSFKNEYFTNYHEKKCGDRFSQNPRLDHHQTR